MLGSSVLDIGIGLVFVYLIVSLVCTATTEALASLLRWRGTDLREGIRNLLDGPDQKGTEWAEKFYNHSLVRGLSKPGERPSYIPSRTFALALADLVLPADGTGKVPTAPELRTAIDASPCPPGLKQVLRVLLDEAERTTAAGQTLKLAGILDLHKLDTVFGQLQRHIEIWFNNSMERVSGWYKRRVQAWTIAIALVLTIGLNADSVLIAKHLARDSALRSAIVAQAQQMVQQPVDAQAAGARIPLMQDRIAELKSVGFPIGWPDPDGPPAGVPWFVLKVFGILLTAGAASLGAPFWFDVLGRFMSIRSAGRAPEEMPLSPRQIPTPAAPGPAEQHSQPAA
jgi:hypothetical protein